MCSSVGCSHILLQGQQQLQQENGIAHPRRVHSPAVWQLQWPSYPNALGSRSTNAFAATRLLQGRAEQECHLLNQPQLLGWSASLHTPNAWTAQTHSSNSGTHTKNLPDTREQRPDICRIYHCSNCTCGAQPNCTWNVKKSRWPSLNLPLGSETICHQVHSPHLCPTAPVGDAQRGRDPCGGHTKMCLRHKWLKLFKKLVPKTLNCQHYFITL